MVRIELQDEDVERAAFGTWLQQRGGFFRVYVLLMLVSAALLLRLYCRARTRAAKSPPTD